MRNFWLALFLSFCVNASYSATPIDSLKTELNQMRKTYQTRNDSLQRELQFYKVKEDYFANAVDRQGSHFEFLVSTLVALIGFAIAIFGFFSFKFIDRKIAASQEIWNAKINEQEKLNADFLTKTDEIKANFHSQLALLISRVSIAPYRNEKNDEILHGLLDGLLNYIESYTFEKNPENIKILKRLIGNSITNCTISSNHVLTELDEIEEGVNYSILEQKKRLIKKMHLIDDEDFKLRSVELISLLNKINATINKD